MAATEGHFFVIVLRLTLPLLLSLHAVNLLLLKLPLFTVPFSIPFVQPNCHHHQFAGGEDYVVSQQSASQSVALSHALNPFPQSFIPHQPTSQHYYSRSCLSVSRPSFDNNLSARAIVHPFIHLSFLLTRRQQAPPRVHPHSILPRPWPRLSSSSSTVHPIR